MELEGQIGAHHISGTESDPKVVNGKLRKEGAGELCTRTSNARLKCSRREHRKQFRQS